MVRAQHLLGLRCDNPKEQLNHRVDITSGLVVGGERSIDMTFLLAKKPFSSRWSLDVETTRHPRQSYLISNETPRNGLLMLLNE